MAEMKQFGIDLELDDTVAQGHYSNLAIISHSTSEFIIDFAAVLPGVQKARVKSRIILTPNTPNGCCVRCRRISCVMKAMWARSKFPLLRRFPKRVPRWVKLKIATARP